MSIWYIKDVRSHFLGEQGIWLNRAMYCMSHNLGFYDYLLIPLVGKLEVCRVSQSLVAALNLTTERLGLPLTIRTRNIEPCGLGGGPVYRSTVLPYSDAAPLTP